MPFCVCLCFCFFFLSFLFVEKPCWAYVTCFLIFDKKKFSMSVELNEEMNNWIKR